MSPTSLIFLRSSINVTFSGKTKRKYKKGNEKVRLSLYLGQGQDLGLTFRKKSSSETNEDGPTRETKKIK